MTEAAKKIQRDKQRERILQYGKEIIGLEANAIQKICSALNESFLQAVELVLDCSPGGRVITAGMGKAGIIAMKVSATLASTGTSSFFLHPAEAIHGDLGRYNHHDIALMFSNSGETDEMLRIIPSIKRMGCPLISVTARPESSLAKQSDVVLLIPDTTEAGPLGLAPTTSTTCMLALGDALSMAILNERSFSKEEFALFHPGGKLGRSLMPIKEIMRTGEDHCLVHDQEITREVLHKYTATPGRPGAATVISQSGKLAGIFTDGDLRRCLNEGTDFLDQPIHHYMAKNPTSIYPEQLASEGLRIMSEKKIDQLVVVDEQQKPVGLLDIQDLSAIRIG